MIELSTKDLEDYNKNGWCLLKSSFSYDELLNYQKSVYDIELKAKKLNFKTGRIYFDYIQGFNLAAVEDPLNPIVCDDNVYNFFKKLKLGKVINKLMGWDGAVCVLLRLFCMGNFNYSGHWHQDEVKNSVIQVSIFFKDEIGFKIIKKDKLNEFLSKEIDKILSSHNKNNVLPTIINKKFYHTLNLKIGDVLLFNPVLFHKGSSNNKRLNFHMRFYEKSEIPDRNLIAIKDFDFNIDKHVRNEFCNSENKVLNKNIPLIKRNTIFRRLKNSVNYFFPIFNFFYYLKQHKSNNKFKYEIFANTVFQKKEV